ncbi:hypothetical protein Agub_g9515 [Astrephomene gubernaculifera]|uniref:Calcium-transporting ATPase n=1 Tax=Astrephomene gubernaculifera TaxID=47775 RepID=A0AAD3HPC8_9CHLO|nr:hypothetical protein Agub_g9515 [Astrephomene gubernaculifera]
MPRDTTMQGDVEAPASASCSYGVGFQELTSANEVEDMEFYERVGKAEGLARLLSSSVESGLNPDPGSTGPDSVAEHRRVFGANTYREAPPKNFFALVWEVVQDPILILLILAALVSTVLGSAIPEERKNKHWIEGVAIWVAVIVVTLVGAGNDYSKDLQFRKLNALKDKIKIKVIRGGDLTLVDNTDIVVGDVVFLDTGDKVVADGLVIRSEDLTLDEASLTGESEPVKKDTRSAPWVKSGTKVTQGSGHVLVTAVGEHSEWGRTLALVAEAGDEETPLQAKLEVLAVAIGKIGFAVAVCCFIAQLIKWCVVNRGFPIKKINDNGPIQFFLYAITIIVVAVPEGLPLAVTISLAYSMKKMLKDNNFVRVLSACETMGGATAICSDKTGTLTENRMTVVEGWFGGRKYDTAPSSTDLHPVLLQELVMNCALNSKATFEIKPDGKMEFTGNGTECALLLLLHRNFDVDYKAVRHQHEKNMVKMYGFSSAKKMASVLIRLSDRLRLYNKGAAEWVLARCTKLQTESGAVEMTPLVRESLLGVVTAMAKRGLRCICLAHADFPLEDPNRAADFFESSDNVDANLTCVGLVGIKDPVRPEVPAAVATCKRAGITVRMVTGDNIHTAQHIARECGILYELIPTASGAGGVTELRAMEGPAFREMIKDPAFVELRRLMNEGDKAALQQLRDKINHVRVLARSSPEDKLQLVRLLKEMGDVVAVTGDGTNDAPALKESDVGLAMGMTGTEVAKEAADIIILDDNFSSIVKSVLWGRAVFANIRKFLQFQLTVNLVALVTAFVGAVAGGHEPLNILQLLWVNLIMDTMGALALATEDPHPALLLQRPNGRTEYLINWRMCKHIAVQGSYQILFMFLCLYLLPTGPKGLEQYKVHTRPYYYNLNCAEKARDALPGRVNITTANLDSAADFSCNVLTSCGLPYTTNITTSPCVLADPWVAAGMRMPSDRGEAVCMGPFGFNTTNCDLNDWVQAVESRLDDDFKTYEEDEYKRPLSVLFNIFICTQVANEINSRRINDEYGIFSGFFNNWIFLAVIAITMGLQAIIINFLGIFFRVVSLNWQEWLVSLAIGAGAWPLSLLTRFISRNLPCCAAFEAQLPPEIDDPALLSASHASPSAAGDLSEKAINSGVAPAVSPQAAANGLSKGQQVAGGAGGVGNGHANGGLAYLKPMDLESGNIKKL